MQTASGIPCFLCHEPNAERQTKTGGYPLCLQCIGILPLDADDYEPIEEEDDE